MISTKKSCIRHKEERLFLFTSFEEVMGMATSQNGRSYKFEHGFSQHFVTETHGKILSRKSYIMMRVPGN